MDVWISARIHKNGKRGNRLTDGVTQSECRSSGHRFINIQGFMRRVKSTGGSSHCRFLLSSFAIFHNEFELLKSHLFVHFPKLQWTKKKVITTNDHHFNTQPTDRGTVTFFFQTYFFAAVAQIQPLLCALEVTVESYKLSQPGSAYVQILPLITPKTSLCKTSVGTSINESAAPNRILLILIFMWFSCIV